MTIGHNTIKSDELMAFIERIERLRAEKADLTADEKQVMLEAQAKGFSPAAIRLCVKVRAMEPDAWSEWRQTRAMYLHAIGKDSPLPLFDHDTEASTEPAKKT